MKKDRVQQTCMAAMLFACLASGAVAQLAGGRDAEVRQRVLAEARSVGEFGASIRDVFGQVPVWDRPTLSFYGTPGLIDMPTGHAMKDGDFSVSYGLFEGTGRMALNFQIMPRVSGTFRYSQIDDYLSTGTLYDRSFDVRFLLAEESAVMPALTLGLNDIGGTGIYSSEYLAASKTFDRLRVTAGLGWGRLASRDGFDNPLGVLGSRFDTRPSDIASIEETGQLDADVWFRGPAALFGGLQYQVSDRLVLTAEYSTDAYEDERARQDDFDYGSPLNFGATYRWRSGVDLSMAYLYGHKVGLLFNYTLNPKTPSHGGGVEGGGLPIQPRDQAAALGWGELSSISSPARANLVERLQAGMAAEGLRLEAFEMLAPDRVQVHFTNTRYGAVPQALGRTARVLSSVMPPQVGTFVLVPVAEGVPLSAVTLSRDDLEELEFDFDGSWKMLGRARVEDAADRPLQGAALAPGYPAFSYGLSPYLLPSYFAPENPLRLDFGLQLSAEYTPRPGFILSSRLRYKLAGNLDDEIRPSNSVLPHVRTDAALYDAASPARLESLTAEFFNRPGQDLYSRLTLGYLERMYAGVSGEMLWKPVDSPLALGLEVNYVQQRDFDNLLGLQDYDVVTGHASAYYDFGNGFLGQLDLGRYLAGDWGGTISLDREFNNGFRVGAFATFTDVSFDDFGEGSFDKGIRFWIPLSRLRGEPSQSGFGQTIRPVSRDGGARLNVRNRLYDMTRDSHMPELQEDWGRFWR